MMQPTKDLLSLYGARFGRLHWSRLQTVFLQPQIGPAPVTVVQVVTENPPEIPLAQGDHVIEAFSPDRPDHPLDIGGSAKEIASRFGSA